MRTRCTFVHAATTSVIALGLTLAAALGGGASAYAQTPAIGFATDRLYTSAPGAGWIVMDDLAMHGPLGGTISGAGDYARDPLHLPAGPRANIVSDQGSTRLGVAVTYERFRFYGNLTAPYVSQGNDATVAGYSYTAPHVDLGKNPDTYSDVRLGVDARVLGRDKSPFRLGVSAQLWVPSGEHEDFLTDGTYRAMGRVLAAGEVGSITYAGHLGVHIRPVDDAAPGAPKGSELLFGVAGGPKLSLDASHQTALIVGPEFFGETAFSSFFGHLTTAFEGMLTGRIEHATESGPVLRLKAALGAGLDAEFGAAEWRTVISFEVSDHVRKQVCPPEPVLMADPPPVPTNP